MKVLLDECLPKALIYEFPDHEVWTVPQRGWARKKNGELLKLMSEYYEVFVTVDGNLEYQQRLKSAVVGFIVLHVPTNRIEDVLPLAPQIRDALQQGIAAGEIIHIE
jgi:hypothetical protein